MDPELKETVDFIRAGCRRDPAVGLVLGSGFGTFADIFTDRTVFPYNSIPNFRSSTVSGHSGNLVLGFVEGVPCAALQGRIHFYEGYSMREVAFPVRVLGALGIRRLIVTNSAGGIHSEFHPGDLMLIEDHINMMGSSPLIGSAPDEPGPRFPDMCEAYDGEMRETARRVARKGGIALRSGVYVGVTGPSYETPAEIRMFRALGADAVGMSTIPEVISAVKLGIRVCGISCITNPAAGMSDRKISHGEVLEATAGAERDIHFLLTGIIKAEKMVPGT